MPQSAIDDFLAQLDQLYGYYLDCTMGFVEVHNMILRAQSQFTNQFSLQELDSLEFAVGFGGDPGEPGHVRQHTATQGEVKRRNSPNGKNYREASQNFIIILFAYWDHEYRSRIEQSLRLQKDELKIPVMGDIRRLRNDILHCAGRVRAETIAKLEVLKHFTPEQQIFLDKDQTFAVLNEIKAYFAQLQTDLVRKS